MAFLIGGANSKAADAYDIDNSLRFNRDDSPRLTDTTNATGDKQKFTVSAWVKHHYKGSGGQYIWNMYHGSPSDANWLAFGFNADSKFACQSWNSDLSLLSTAQHRDPSAWYHVVLAVDTTQSTEALRARVYINGSEITAWGTENRPDQNHEYNAIGTSGATIAIGCAFNDGSPPLAYGFQDFYLADFYFIDGTQYAPGDFGETDEDSGIWKPKDAKDDLTFGSNGLFLEFGTSGTLGEDTSGNSDDLTSTNLAATDQATDTPTNNFCVLNAINPTEANASFTEGNLKFTNTLNSSPHHGLAHGTMAVAKGKWYWEVRVDAIGGTAMGIGAEEVSAFGKNNVAGNQGISLFNHGYTHQRGSDVAVSGDTTYTTNDIIGVALDMDNRKIYFHKDGTYFNSGDPTSGATGTGAISFNAADVTMTPAVSNYNSGICNVNFGNPAWTVSSTQADDDGYGNFEFDVPAGFYALCTKNLAEYG